MSEVDDLVWVLWLIYVWIVDSLKAIIPLELLPQKSIQSQLALVTGGAGGIGKHLALELVRQGAKVVLWDINKNALSEAIEWIKEESGVEVASYVVDLSKKEEIYRVAALVRKEHGDVDLLFNNAGASTGYSFEEPNDERLETCIRVNLIAHFYTIKAFLPSMIRNNKGHIMATASSWALLADGSFPDYSAAKAGVVGLMRSLRLELKRENLNGIKSTIMFPTYVSTPLCQGYVHKSIILPQLEPGFVAQRTIQAVLANQTEILLPRSFYFVNFLHKITPTSVADELSGLVTGRCILNFFERKGLMPQRKSLRESVNDIEVIS
ncbi:hypothetical protein M3Y95_01089400 [Aphelenchoides besseyi]|nr:hypothetical protein M3Y95_01089400 [Aphelenchoides besseyi]